MVKCPKCGFESSEEACARCGVIFSKLRSPRPHRPTQERPHRPMAVRSGTSHLNVIVLASVMVLAGLSAWHLIQRNAGNEVAEDRPPAEIPKRLTAEPADVPIGGEIRPRPGGGVLRIRGVGDGPSNNEGPTVEPPSFASLDLPTLNTGTITPEIVRQITEAADQHPDFEGLQEYAAHAHLILALRQFREGRYRDALASAAKAEKAGAPPQDVARLTARTYLELQDLGHAREWAQTALAFGPDPDMYAILGKVYYLREELAKAVEAWEQSLALKEDPTVRASLEKALREAKVADSFDKQRLSHFIVRYEGESMEDTGRLVLDSLERSYSFLKSRLDFEPSELIVVILYARRDYSELGGPAWSAGLFDGKVRVPVRGLVGLDKHVESTLRHELTHAFLFAQAGQNCPRWLHEGMAEYAEGADASEHGKMLAERIQADGDFAYCLLGARCNVRFFYPAATSVVDYIIRTRGMGGIKDLLTLLGEGRSIDEALRTVTGRDELGLMNDWQYFVKRRYL